jgi:hypothetical protein
MLGELELVGVSTFLPRIELGICALECLNIYLLM